MHTCSRTGAFAFLLVATLLWAGCDSTGTNGPSASRPAVQFASGTAAVVPTDGTYNIDVILSDSVGASVGVEVLFASQASSATFADVGTFDSSSTTKSVTFPASAEPGAIRSVEVDVSDAAITEGPKEAFFALQNLDTEANAEIGSPREFALNIGFPPLSGLREQGVGTTGIFQAIVTEVADDDARVQDQSAGIAVTRRTDFTDAVQRGDEVVITGTISEFANQLQIDTDDLQNYEIVSSGNELPAATTVTIPDIQENVDEYESERVRVKNLTFQAEGTFQAGGSEGNYTVTDGNGNEMTLRIPSGSYFEGETIPENAVTFEGVLGEFFSGPQLRAQYEDNIIQ